MAEFFGDISALQWFAIAGLLLVLELTTGTLYLLFVALAAIAISALNWLGPDMSWETDLVLFFVLSTALLLIGHFVVKPRLREEAAEGLNEPANALVGRRARAVADFQTGEGRVKLGDTEWRARTDDSIHAGEELVIVAVEGSTLLVQARES
jgi:membrane protein implicated in regulation of membrane protease activity